MAAKKKASDSKGDAVDGAVRTALAALATAKAALAGVGLARLTAEERKVSAGRLREEEPKALEIILNTVDAHPALFASLADRDGGADPSALETGPARAGLARFAKLAPVEQALEELLTSISDDRLAAASFVKSVTVPAYGIAKANAPVNPKLRKAVAGALDFYGRVARPRKK